MRETAKRDESFCQLMLFSLDTWGVRISASTSYLDEAVLNENDQKKMKSSTNIGKWQRQEGE